MVLHSRYIANRLRRALIYRLLPPSCMCTATKKKNQQRAGGIRTDFVVLVYRSIEVEQQATGEIRGLVWKHSVLVSIVV